MMHSTILVLLLIPLLFDYTSCAPIDTGEPSYVSGPDGRGTIELLWSCSITFGLCIWTAMHPNVIPWDSFWDEVFYKLGWMGLAVLVPELIVCVAASQLIQAKQVRDAWEERFGAESRLYGQNVKDWLGMPGAFFVVMGGFVIEELRMPCTDKAEMPSGTSSESPHLHTRSDLVTTINPTGFMQLLQNGVIPQLILDGKLTKEHFLDRNIKDKGKADGVAKFLVSIQILWMGVQCLGRKINGLPLSLLEAHVLIQLPFAVAAYLCWWHKPLDVSEPIRLRIETDRLTEIILLARQDEETSALQRNFTTERKHTGGLWQMFLRVVHDIIWHLRLEAEIAGTAMAIVNGGLHAIAWNTHFPTAVERQLWRVTAIGNGLMPVVVLWVAWVTNAQAYGLQQAFEERWREARFFSVGNATGLVWGLAKDVIQKPEAAKYNAKPWPAWTPMWMRFLVVVVGLVALAAYLLCVAYLTVESFLSMRSLPKGGFATFEWSDFFPHI